MFVPVKTKDGEVLMPMHAARARKLVQRGEATSYWDNGIYGLTRLSGINAKGLFSIYSLDGKRITTGAKRQDFKVLKRLNFNYRSGLSSPT